MKQINNRRSLSLVSALLVLAVFAVGVLGVLLGGAQAYRRLTARDDVTFDRRTCMQYLAGKVRQAPEVTVSRFGGGDALVIRETYNEKDYLTRIYCHNGWLMELFTADSGEFAPEDGEKILPVKALALTLAEGLLTAEVLTEDGHSQLLKLRIREVQP